MIKLIEVGPDDPTRNLKQVQPGVFATGREMEISRKTALQVLGPKVAYRMDHAKVAFLEQQVFEKFLPENERAEKTGED